MTHDQALASLMAPWDAGGDLAALEAHLLNRERWLQECDFTRLAVAQQARIVQRQSELVEQLTNASQYVQAQMAGATRYVSATHPDPLPPPQRTSRYG
jgi:hypothetical protein